MATSLLDLPLLRQYLVFMSQVLGKPECVHSDSSPCHPWEFTLVPVPQWPPIRYLEESLGKPRTWNPPEWWVAFCETVNTSAGGQLIDPKLEPSPFWKRCGTIALVSAYLTRCGLDEATDTQKKLLQDVVTVLKTYRKWHELVMAEPITTRAFRQLLDETLLALGEKTRGSEGDKTAPPDGPFEPFGFRWAGREIDLSNAPLRFRLATALWDVSKGRPHASRKDGEVIDELWPDEDESEGKLKNLVYMTQDAFHRGHLTVCVRRSGGKIWLEPSPA